MRRCGAGAGSLRHWVRARLQRTRDDGFILLESVIAITVITVVMGAVGAEFVNGMILTNQQRVQQGAVQVASSTADQIRALDPSDLLAGRGTTSVDTQFAAALPAVQPWLTTMDKASDASASATSGIAAAVPTCGTTVLADTCQKTPGTVTYTINQYLGWCSTSTGTSGDCVKSSTMPASTTTRYLRAVIAVTWSGPRCGTACSFVSSTLVSNAADPTFRINAAPYAAPVVLAKSLQTVVVGDTVSLAMQVQDGTGVLPFQWAVSAGALPTGLTLDPLRGLITGTVGGEAGELSSTIKVTDAFIRSDTEEVGWKVLLPLTATTPATRTSAVSAPLSPELQLDATGGSGTYAWSDATPRTLPGGLTLSASGRVSGIPTAVGSSTVTLTVASGGSTKSVTFVWNVVRLTGARYDFEEGTGTTAADGSGNNNTATLQPGAGWTTGKVNAKALSLTGADNSSASAVSPVIDSSQSFTVASWVKLTSVDGYQTIAAMDGASVSPFYLQKEAGTNHFKFELYRSDTPGGNAGSVAGVTPTVGVWYYVAGVFDQAAGTATLYVDGVSQGTTTGVTAFRAAGQTTIGRAKFDGRPVDFLKGALDDTRFYDRPLTAAEIGALASSGAAGPTGGSVDATGLTGTANRYSTSTTLSLALAKGSDPDGVAATGAQLYRATAPLTSGACGTYGVYTQVGADNPGTPFATTVADEACYRYRYRVVDNLGNSSAYVSPDIKVDTSRPSTPTLGFSGFSNTSLTGSTIYYRPGAGSGGFTLTASSADPVAGIASYTFPGLGTGWTSTVGAQGVTTYSWATPSPATPGSPVVTATNNAGSASTGSPLAVTPDSTPPSAGTLTYPDRSGSSTSVSVSFTSGTDSGSGIGTRLLQRASAPLSGSTCGTFTGFATVSGGTNPTSPLVDTVTNGSCFKYQYVVSDQVGNTATVTSASVVKVRSTYADTVLATAGLLNWYRLGDAKLSSDSFTDASQTLLNNHTGELGAAWTFYQGSDVAKVSSANRLYRSGNDFSAYYTSAAPTSANYSVEADLVFRSNIRDDYAGVVGRVDTGAVNAYGARWQQGPNNGSWVLYKYNNGGLTTLASTSAAARTTNQVDRIRLEMVGTAIRLYVDGVLTASATDSTITAAGRAGIFDGNPSGTIAKTDSTGVQYDNFSVAPVPAPRATDSKGTNVGDYFNGVVLGVAGAITADANDAVSFDGVDDYVSVTRTIQDDFAIEFWFKSTQGIGTGSNWWEGAGLVDAEVNGAANDFGVSLRSDGRVVAGDGTPDVSIVSPAGGYNNGAWHHVVFNRTKSTGVLQLFLDGANVGTATGSKVSLTSPASISFGRLANATNYLVGSLDEIAFYNSVLSPATVTSHYQAGQ